MLFYIDYLMAPLLVLGVAFALAVLGFAGSRRSRRLVEQYRSATPEERAHLDAKMDGSFWLHAGMRAQSFISVLGGIIGFVVLMMILKWLGF